MLSVMGERSFVVTYAYIKTEPVQVALFGLIFLGDSITPLSAVAILIATAGVIVMSLKPGAGRSAPRGRPPSACSPARMFALSAIGYRGAILSLDLPNFVLAATFTVTVGLVMQAARAVALSRAARSAGAARDRARLAAVDVRRLHGRVRLGILVPRLCHHHAPPMCARWRWSRCCSRRRHVLRLQAADQPARGVGIVLIVIGVALLVWAY